MVLALVVLGWGGVLEVWSVELTQPVLAGWLYLPCKWVLAQDAQGCADSQYAEPAQDILVHGGILETRSAEPAPSFLAGCPF